MSVTVGIWLGHERHGFRYDNPEMVAAQFEKAKAAFQKYKDHPAVLMWGIGNEMEGDGKNEAIFVAVNNIAKMAKEVDPNHPTMTVISEFGDKGDKVKNIHRLCPDIDVIGVNSGGGPSVAERYKQFGATKPFILTEFGPNGAWETARTTFKAPIEPTSTQKAAAYRAVYEKSVLGAKGTCIGSYAFVWGSKMEATATWFGMVLPDGTRLASAETMSELWTGKPPANRVPIIHSIAFEGADRGKKATTSRSSSQPPTPRAMPSPRSGCCSANPRNTRPAATSSQPPSNSPPPCTTPPSPAPPSTSPAQASTASTPTSATAKAAPPPPTCPSWSSDQCHVPSKSLP